MPKIKKLKRKKRFRANVNRKRLRNKLRKLPNIECKEIAEAWKGHSIAKNLTQMGLAADPNKALAVPNIKKKMLQQAVDKVDEKPKKKFVPKKAYVAEKLEEDAKWPRAKLLRLPNNEVQFATYMMDKYGDDYKAMERDRRNFYQLTSNQIRRKIERFKSIPEQYAEYLVKKGEIVLDDPIPLKKLKPIDTQDILIEPVKTKRDAKRSRRKRQKSNILETVAKEESNDEDVDFNTSKTLSNDVEVLDSEENSSQFKEKKKLQLFSEHENEDKEMEDEDYESLGSDNREDNNDDDDDDDDDNDDDNEDGEKEESDSEDQTNKKIKVIKNKVSNTKNNKVKKVLVTDEVKEKFNNKIKGKNIRTFNLKNNRSTKQKIKRLNSR